MRREPAVALKEDDFAGLQLARIAPLHGDEIAGTYHREHAGPSDFQLHLPAAARNLGDEIAACRLKVRIERHSRRRYEVLRLKWHEACVVCTLPQDNAMVSNTRSCRTSGFTYGFLAARFASPAGATRCFWSVEFVFTYLPRSIGVSCVALRDSCLLSKE